MPMTIAAFATASLVPFARAPTWTDMSPPLLIAADAVAPVYAMLAMPTRMSAFAVAGPAVATAAALAATLMAPSLLIARLIESALEPISHTPKSMSAVAVAAVPPFAFALARTVIVPAVPLLIEASIAVAPVG